MWENGIFIRHFYRPEDFNRAWNINTFNHDMVDFRKWGWVHTIAAKYPENRNDLLVVAFSFCSKNEQFCKKQGAKTAVERLNESISLFLKNEEIPWYTYIMPWNEYVERANNHIDRFQQVGGVLTGKLKRLDFSCASNEGLSDVFSFVTRKKLDEMKNFQKSSN